MPSLASNASTYRAGKYFALGYIGNLPQTVAMSRAVNMSTITYPLTSIVFDNPYSGSGATANVKEGMTIVVYSGNTTTIKGYLRVAAGGTTATVIQVNEFSAGTVNLADNDKFDVLETYRIWDKLVSASAALNKDSRTAYSAQGSNPPPIANCGGLWYGFVDDGQTFATVTFEANVSINVDPDSSASKTYLWNVGDGTITVGSTTTSGITVRFPVGFRHVQLTVTDSGNSQSTTRQIPVRVYNRTTTLPLVPSDVSLDYTDEDGWSARFQLPKGSESAISSLPDGALIVYFEDEYYGSTRVSYGSNVSGRSHIKFVGYLVRDSISIDPEDNSVTFEALSPLGILNKTPVLPQLMVQTTGAGTLWRHVKTLNVNRMYWYLSHWHSTLDSYFDFVWTLDGTILTYRRIAVSEVSSLGAQLRDIAQSVNTKVTCDRLGRILMVRDFNYLSTSDRSSRTALYAFTTADIERFEFTREHRGTVKYVEGQGITDGLTAGSNRVNFSSGPGKAPAPFGTGSETLARQIVDNQTDLNNRTGWHFAKINGLYTGSPYGRFVPQGARLVLPDGYDWIDPAYNESFTITAPATTNKRAVAFDTTTRWTADAVSITLDAETGTKEVNVTVSHETDGAAGATKVKRQPAQNGLPSFPPIDLTMPPPLVSVPNAPLILGADTLAMFAYNTTSVVFLSNFNNPAASGGPTVTTVLLPVVSNFQSVIADPWSPRYLPPYTGAVNVWLATSTRLYTIEDLFGARTVTQRLVFTASPTDAVVTRVLATERNAENRNFVICASYYASTAGKEGVWIARTTDGTTWSESQLTGHYNSGVPTGASQRTPTAWVSAKIPGRAYAFAFTATGSQQAATSQMYKSDDYGASWSQMSGFSNAQSLGYNIHVPWHNNDNDRYIYWTKNDTSTSMTLMRTDTTTGIATTLGLTAPAGSGKAGAWPGPISLASSDIDRRRMMVCGSRIQVSGVHAVALYGSYDAGDTWTQLTDEVTAANGRFTAVRFAPNSVQALYIGGEDAQEFGYTDNFATYIDHKYDGAVDTQVMGVIGG